MRVGVFFRSLALIGMFVLAQGVFGARAETSTPESRYQAYRKSIESGKDGAPGSTIYNRSDTKSSYGKPAPRILNLKQILSSDSTSKYGMQTRATTPPVPYGAGPKGPKPPPSAAEMQEMARMDRERTVAQSVAESNERLARIQRMQAELYGKPATLPATGWGQSTAAPSAASGGEAQTSGIRYTYRKTDPTQVAAPPKVFLSNR